MAREREEDQDKDGCTLKGYSSGATISHMRRDARDRVGWRGAATSVARGRIRLDGTRCREVKLEFSFDSKKYLHFFPFNMLLISSV